MAEVVGLIASVLQLVDVVARARSYIKDFRDAPKDQQLLLVEIQNLDTLLRALDKRVKSNNAAGLTNTGMQEVEGPLIELKRTMDRLTKKLDSKGISQLSSRFTWSLWGKEDIQEGMNSIERFKSSVNAWVGLDNWDSAQVIAKSMRDVARNQETYHNSSERDKIIEWYSPLNFFRRQEEIFRSRQPGTGGWLLESNEIKEWQSGTGKTVWCRGIPGAGKTVLASIMVNNLRTNFETPNTGVAAIYLNRKENDAQSPSNLLAAVWQQLVFQKPISSTMHQLYETHREQRTRPSLEETYFILASTVSELSSAFIVVDALDEYPEEQRDTLLVSLSTLGPNVNLMLMSRPHINIEGIVSTDLGILEVRADEEDIRRYVAGQITKSSRLAKHIKNCPDLEGEIEQRIIGCSDGMFLLAKLNIDSLVTKHTVKAVRDALKNMPGDLNSTYDEVMERIDQQSEEDKTLARRTLCWISNAETVLHISELVEALAIEPGTTDLDPDNLLEMDIIVSVCAGLVIIDEVDRLVRLVHYTAQDYLDRIQDREFPHAQTEIAGACITYLSFQKFARARDLELGNLVDENPLLEYALLFCLIHARGAPELQIKDDILRFLTRLSADSENTWQIMRSLHTSLPRTRLGIAAYFGMLEVARHLIEEDGFDKSALRRATINGHADMIHLLMESRQHEQLGSQLKTPEKSTTIYTGRKKALLIGIRTVQSEAYPELEAVHEDVYKMRDLLLETYDYGPTEISILVDDDIPGHVQPARDNILAAIAELVKDVKDGDRLFFLYCGHSAQAMNRSNTEEDGMDECLIALDGEEIVDNELHCCLVSPLPSGVRLVTVLETTHSSSLLDLQHYRCNRVFVPWIEKGRRYSDDRWDRVVRRHALPMLSIYPTHTLSTQTSPTHRPPTQISPTRTLPTRISSTHPLPLSSTPRRSISITQPLPSSDDVRQQGLGEVEERSTSISSKSSWILSEEERCESPVAIYPCSGWCRDRDSRTDDTVWADVISLASSSESQWTFEDDDQTMTSSLVEFLREDPRKSLRDVLLYVSHVSYSVAFKRHVETSQRKRKAPVDTLVRFIARLERETRSTASAHNNVSASPTSPNMRTKSGAVPGWMNNQIAWLKQKLKEVRENHNLDDFRTPELSSLRPLDLNREWGM